MVKISKRSSSWLWLWRELEKSSHAAVNPDLLHNKGLPSKREDFVRALSQLGDIPPIAFLSHLRLKRKIYRGQGFKEIGMRSQRSEWGRRRKLHHGEILVKIASQRHRLSKRLRFIHEIIEHFPSPIPDHHINKTPIDT